MERALSHDIPIGATQVSLVQLNERSRDIFRQIVESYLATGEPVGSRNISHLITTPLSPASVRNVMSDLEQLGLIYAPHTSAGRLPTELGLRFFVDALMQIGDLDRKSTRLNSSHTVISYAVFCLKKKRSKSNRICSRRDRIGRRISPASSY